MTSLMDNITIISHNEEIKNSIEDKFSKISLALKSKLSIVEVFSREAAIRNLVLDFDDEKTNYYENGDYIYEYLDGSIIVYLKNINQIKFFINDEKHISAIIVLITIFMCIWLSCQKVLWLHASAFKYKGKNIMVLGNSGSGKSSMTLMAIYKKGEIISEENTCIDFNELDPVVCINKHHISICDGDLTNYSHLKADSLYKNKYVKDEKTYINTSLFNYYEDLCKPDYVFILNDTKFSEAKIEPIHIVDAIKTIIKLHPCFNNYDSKHWSSLVMDLSKTTSIFNVYPSFIVQKTFDAIEEVIL